MANLESPERSPAQVSPSNDTRVRVLLVNAFEKIPGESFRDQRYTFLYQLLSAECDVLWLSSDFHHWSHRRRSIDSLPAADRGKVVLIRTPAYSNNVSLRRFFSYLTLSLRTVSHLRKLPWRPDVVLCMGPVEQMFLVSLYGRLRNVPVIIDVIDTWPDLYVQAFPLRLRWLGRVLLAPYFLLSRLTFSWASHVTAVSNTYLQWAMRRGRRADAEHFACFPLGCRNPGFDATAIMDARPPLRCLFAGQFGHSYDVELIVEAAELLAAAGRTDVEFVMCGDGSKLPELRRRTGNLRNVRLLGWLSPQELNQLAADCHLGLCCYRAGATQSVPTKIFDYLSMGLFVISSLPQEAAVLLHSHGAGASYRAGDVGSFLELLDTVAARVDLSPDARRRIRRSFEATFESQVIFRAMIRDCIVPVARSGRATSLQPSPPARLGNLRSAEATATGPGPDQTMNASDIQVRAACCEDVDTIVGVHLSAFPGFFLSRLGPGFLQQLYRTFVTDPDGICLVAESAAGTSRRIVGFVAGSSAPAALFRRALLRRGLQFAWSAAGALLLDPVGVGRRLLAATRYRGERPAAIPTASLLSSLGVAPNARTAGVGRALISGFCGAARSRHSSHVYLTTDQQDNDAVNRFYHSLDFTVHATTSRPDGRVMITYVKAI